MIFFIIKQLSQGDEILLGTLADKCSLGDSIEVDDEILEEAKPSAIIGANSALHTDTFPAQFRQSFWWF